MKREKTEMEANKLQEILTAIQQKMVYLEHDIRNAKLWEDDYNQSTYEQGVADTLDMYEDHKENMQEVMTMITEAIYENRKPTLPTAGQLPLPMPEQKAG